VFRPLLLDILKTLSFDRGSFYHEVETDFGLKRGASMNTVEQLEAKLAEPSDELIAD
jgi:hypothetical protein